jgi:aryl carrier-like protein
LIEAAYLLYQKPRPNNKRHELLQQTLQSFFNYASLAKWKKQHHAFTYAALFKSSVAEELSAVTIIRHFAFLKKLIMQTATIALTAD